MEEETKEVFTCEFCKEYTGDKRQLNMHKLHCKSKPPEPPAPAKEPEPSPKRKERIPFGSPTRKFNTPDNDGYHYHIFNDNWRREPGRIQRALRAGYEKVEGYEPSAVGVNEDGSPIKGILMRIPQEMYDADQKLKQQEVDKVDEAIKGGTIEKQAGDKRYIPDRYVPEGIRIHSNNNENR